MYLEENGSQIAGRKVEVIVEDTQGQPAVALTKLRKLVESDQVHAWPAFFSPTWATRWRRRSTSTRSRCSIPSVSADDLTQRKPAKWVVRTGWTSSQPNHPFGEYGAQDASATRGS